MIYSQITMNPVASSGTENGWKVESNSELEYKIVREGGTRSLAYGNYMQLHVKQVYSDISDTILIDTRETMPRTQIFDSVSTPIGYYNMIRQLKNGDSLVIRILAENAFKNSPVDMPSYLKTGRYLYTHVKLLNIFSTSEEADSANTAETIMAKPRMYQKQMAEVEKSVAANKLQIEKDSKIISDYLARNNIKATKTAWGTYISIIKEGLGEKIDSTKIVKVNYTGRNLVSGKVFDSNTDPKFMHVNPLEVNMGEFGIIFGWIDALLHLKKGTKATIYVPSSLAYGESGNGERIKPNENLIFNISVLDVFSEAEYMLKQKQLEERRKTSKKSN